MCNKQTSQWPSQLPFTIWPKVAFTQSLKNSSCFSSNFNDASWTTKHYSTDCSALTIKRHPKAKCPLGQYLMYMHLSSHLFILRIETSQMSPLLGACAFVASQNRSFLGFSALAAQTLTHRKPFFCMNFATIVLFHLFECWPTVYVMRRGTILGEPIQLSVRDFL